MNPDSPEPSDEGEIASLGESREIVRRLSSSQLFRDYEAAFTEATGLSMALRPVETFQFALRNKNAENPFCALMARTNETCVACLRMQSRLEKDARIKPKTLHCFAGLCDTAVPVRVGDKTIAFLQTGQVLLHEPDQAEFSRLTQQLLEWGAEVDLRTAEEAYFQSLVLSEQQYGAFVKLLETFANHLGVISNKLAVADSIAEPDMVSRAKSYINDHFDASLSLEQAAQSVNTSVRYFCKVFKRATGMTFTDYLARVRVEKAKNLLLNPNLRISEIAFEVGFESLSQFNRSFKRVTGHSPTEYRKSEVAWS